LKTKVPAALQALSWSACLSACAARGASGGSGNDATIRRYEQWLQSQQRRMGMAVVSPRSPNDVAFVLDRRSSPSSGLSVVRMTFDPNQKYYVFGDQTNRLLDPVFADGRAPVVVPIGRWGYIDAPGRFVYPPEFRAANNFDHGIATALLGSRWVLLHKTGAMTQLDPSIRSIADFSGNFAAFRNADRLSGYIDRGGTIVIPAAFRFGRAFCADGTAPVLTTAGWGTIDARGRFVVSPSFENIECFSEGLAAAKRGEWGFINGAGQFVISPTFDAAGSFSDGLAVVQTPKYGFIDRAGSMAVAARYDAAYPFNFGIAKVGIERVNWFLYPISFIVPTDPRYTSWEYVDRTGEPVR
jgi:hypothetical protein